MTNEEIKRLETELWGAADNLRANSKLTAAEYKDPVLGLILLRYAQNKFEEAKKQIEKELPINPRTNQKREVTKNDFWGAGAMYLQDKSQFDFLVNLPESQDIAEAVNNAMRLIETDYKDLEGILPKKYQEFDADLLHSLIRVFNKDAVKNISGDVFGRIYEFFLMKFSMSGASAQEGGDEEGGSPVEKLELLANELKESIRATKGYLKELGFSLSKLMNAKPMEKLAKINEATDIVTLNEPTRTKFEIMARDVFRKYKALYPEDEIKPFIKQFNAIEAIYDALNQKVKTADITEIMIQLQEVVNDSVFINEVAEEQPEYVDLSNLDFDKLKAAFQKIKRKNTVVFDLQKAIEKKLKQMVKENPLRLEFYDKYKEIIEEYNNGKDINATKKAFEYLTDFLESLSEEDSRAMREGLEEETLAIFDLLKKNTLTDKERDEVKKVSKQTLETLKTEKLKVERWRESNQLRAQVKTAIYDTLLWLPQEPYSEDDVNEKTNIIYQHIFTNYYGGGKSVYNNKGCINE